MRVTGIPGSRTRPGYARCGHVSHGAASLLHHLLVRGGPRVLGRAGPPYFSSHGAPLSLVPTAGDNGGHLTVCRRFRAGCGFWIGTLRVTARLGQSFGLVDQVLDHLVTIWVRLPTWRTTLVDAHGTKMCPQWGFRRGPIRRRGSVKNRRLQVLFDIRGSGATRARTTSRESSTCGGRLKGAILRGSPWRGAPHLFGLVSTKDRPAVNPKMDDV
jgi:hypothetical protein